MLGPEVRWPACPVLADRVFSSQATEEGPASAKRTRAAALPQDTTESPADGGGPQKPAAREGKCLVRQARFRGSSVPVAAFKGPLWFLRSSPQPPPRPVFSRLPLPRPPAPRVGLEVSEVVLGPVRGVAGARTAGSAARLRGDSASVPAGPSIRGQGTLRLVFGSSRDDPCEHLAH